MKQVLFAFCLFTAQICFAQDSLHIALLGVRQSNIEKTSNQPGQAVQREDLMVGTKGNWRVKSIVLTNLVDSSQTKGFSVQFNDDGYFNNWNTYAVLDQDELGPLLATIKATQLAILEDKDKSDLRIMFTGRDGFDWVYHRDSQRARAKTKVYFSGFGTYNQTTLNDEEIADLLFVLTYLQDKS
jgi:hypothetical protein